jgi:hypothetical protein
MIGFSPGAMTTLEVVLGPERRDPSRTSPQ